MAFLPMRLKMHPILEGYMRFSSCCNYALVLEARAETMWKTLTLACYLNFNNTPFMRLYYGVNHMPKKLNSLFNLADYISQGNHDHVC